MIMYVLHESDSFSYTLPQLMFSTAPAAVHRRLHTSAAKSNSSTRYERNRVGQATAWFHLTWRTQRTQSKSVAHCYSTGSYETSSPKQ
jgi:hypothetical protein